MVVAAGEEAVVVRCGVVVAMLLPEAEVLEVAEKVLGVAEKVCVVEERGVAVEMGVFAEVPRAPMAHEDAVGLVAAEPA